MVLLFILMLIVTIIFMFKFINKLKHIVIYAHDHELSIFNRTYSNIYQLYSDISFLNKLFDGVDIENCDDPKLKEYLKSAKHMLRLQIYFGCSFFTLGLIDVFI